MRVLDVDHIECSENAWFFRWFCAEPGKYLVTIRYGHWGSENFNAVVDDFGDLVKVK